MMLKAVPNLLPAAIILIITWYFAKFGAHIMSRLFATIGFDMRPERLGSWHAFMGSNTPSAIVAGVSVLLELFFGLDGREAAGR